MPSSLPARTTPQRAAQPATRTLGPRVSARRGSFRLWKLTMAGDLRGHEADHCPDLTDLDPHLQCEACIIPLAVSLFDFLLMQGGHRSLTLVTIAESMAKAVAARRRSRGFLTKVVLDNRIAFEYLLAEPVCTTEHPSHCTWTDALVS